jgi:uncharacterized protein with PQ loop repeat
MTTDTTFLKQSLLVLSKNPILFLLPLGGALLSILIEIIFTRELYYSGGSKVFFPDNILFDLFFAAFTITYFQLKLTKKSISLSELRNKDPDLEVLELYVIFSIYSLVIVYIGGYEGQVRESFSIESNPFSLYAFKIATYLDIVTIIPGGIVIILSSTLASLFFSAWMVRYVVVKDKVKLYGLVESFRRLAFDSTSKDTRKKMLLLFFVSLVISILDFILSNIEVSHISDTLGSYLYQFVILSIVDSLYAPFSLVCLFLIILPIRHPP